MTANPLRGAAALLIGLLPASVPIAQKTTTIHEGTGGSVHVRSEWTVAGAQIAIEYGRPSLKGRALESLIPSGRVWRAGADEATILRTSHPLQIAGSRLADGAYSLYAIPGAAEWQLIINKQTGQWGTSYDDRLDVIRVPMTVSAFSSDVEQLTIALDPDTGGVVLAIIWGRVRAEVRLRVLSATSSGSAESGGQKVISARPASRPDTLPHAFTRRVMAPG
jgi:hypothetical protein